MEHYPRCATCKHYASYDNPNWPGFGNCALITSGEADTVSIDPAYFFPNCGDDDTRKTELDVHETFGCVLHEPKE